MVLQMIIAHGREGEIFHFCSPSASRSAQQQRQQRNANNHQHNIAYENESRNAVDREVIVGAVKSKKRKRGPNKILSASVKKKSTYNYISLSDAVHHVQEQVNVYGVSTVLFVLCGSSLFYRNHGHLILIFVKE